jgi:CheY-like chemotaxis protein
MLLRAQLWYRDSTIVAHTVAVTPRAALVYTDEPARLGDTMRVELSFPGLLSSFTVHTRVRQRRTASGFGDVRGWWLQFACRDELERAQLNALVRRLHDDRSALERLTGAPYRLLLVDDSELTRHVFAARLEAYFRDRPRIVQVDLAADTRDAWRRLLSSDYDMLLLDYFLPNLNGDRLIVRLRNHARLHSLPVLAMSTGAGRARDATIAAGADFFLHKPVVIGDLLHTLEILLATRGDA